MTYHKSVRVLAAALSAEARALSHGNGAASVPPSGVSPAELEDYFLTLTEHALRAVPNDILIAILGGKMRDKLESAGFDMDKILPSAADGDDTQPETSKSARVYRLPA